MTLSHKYPGRIIHLTLAVVLAGSLSACGTNTENSSEVASPASSHATPADQYVKSFPTDSMVHQVTYEVIDDTYLRETGATPYMTTEDYKLYHQVELPEPGDGVQEWTEEQNNYDTGSVYSADVDDFIAAASDGSFGAYLKGHFLTDDPNVIAAAQVHIDDSTKVLETIPQLEEFVNADDNPAVQLHYVSLHHVPGLERPVVELVFWPLNQGG